MYNEIQKKEKAKKSSRCSSLSHKNAKKKRKEKKRKLLSIVRNEDHCEYNAIKKKRKPTV
jgi:hypothetical protein